MYIRKFALASLLALSSKAEENGPVSPNLGLRGSDGTQDESNLAGDTPCGSFTRNNVKDDIRLGGFNGDSTDEKVWGCGDYANPGGTQHAGNEGDDPWMQCCESCGNYLQNNGKMKAGWGCKNAGAWYGVVWLRGCNKHGQTCAWNVVAQDVVKAGIN